MASDNMKSTGWNLFSVGLLGILFGAFNVWVENPRDPTGQITRGCFGISGLVLWLGLTMIYVGYIAAREAGLPISRSRALPFLGSALILGGVVWIIASNLQFTVATPNQTNTGQRYEYSLSYSDWQRIDIPLKHSFFAVAQPGREALLRPCSSDSTFLLVESDLFELMPDGTRGKSAPRFDSPCVLFKSRKNERVALTVTLTPTR